MIGSPLHSKSFAASDLKKLELRTSWGDLEVIGGDYKEVRIEVYAYRRGLLNLFIPEPINKVDFDKLGFRIFRENETIIVKSLNDPDTWFGSLLSGYQVSFRVFAPLKFSVQLKSNVGDIALNNLDGEHLLKSTIGKVRLYGISGSVRALGKSFGGGLNIENCNGNFELATSGGNVNVVNSEGDHTYSTDGGNVNISDFSGKLNARTKGGNVNVNRFEGELKTLSWGGNIKLSGIRASIAATTKGGNLKVDMDELKEYLWLESTGGNVKVDIPENAKMQLDAKGSRVRNYGNFNIIGSHSADQWSGSVNGGGCNVTLRSRGGNITIYEKKFVTQRPVRPKTSPIKDSFSSWSPLPVEPFEKKETTENYVRPPRTKKAINKREKNWKFTPYIPAFSQLLFALLFTVLFVYGLNSITYFTSELFNPTSLEAEQNKAVALLNLTTGLASFLGVILFISLVDKYIQPKWLKYLTLVGITALCFFLIQLFIQSLHEMQHYQHAFWQYYWQITRPQAFEVQPGFSVVLYGTIPSLVACAYYTYWNRSTDLSRKITEQEYQLLNLEKLKTKAQLTALEARINPHFLYNSLNSIAGLIHEDQDKAEDMTVELSKLFRATTGRNNESNHTIEEEISLVKSYLAIEQMRFGDRLKYELNVQESLNKVKIPRFLLQPLVENAIKHGISKITSDGIIKVDIKEADDKIQIDIHDNGPNFGEAVSGGYGLKSVRDKLNLVYGEKATLIISNEPIKNIQLLIDKDHAI